MQELEKKEKKWEFLMDGTSEQLPYSVHFN